MPAAIDPSKIPGKDIDPDGIDAHAATIASVAGSVRDDGSAVHQKWQGMAAVYSAPESGTLLALMQPVSQQATVAGDNLDVVASALTQFAADVRPIKAELDALRAQAQWFVDNTVQDGVRVRELNPAYVSATQYSGSWNAYGAYSSSGDSTKDIPQYRYVTKEWHEDQDAVDRNNELISAVNAQQVALWEAERAAANRIRALYGAQPLRAAQSEDDALAYGIAEIPEGTDMPWGAPVERTEGCGEATFDFVVKDFLWEGIAVGGVWGTVQGLGTLVLGYNPETGDWFSGDAYGAAWGNLGMLAAGAVISSTPPLNLVFMADDAASAFGGGILPDEVRDFKDSTDEAWLNTGKALIAWDKWQDDPGTALGESVFNVGTLLIPVGGAAVAGVKTASTAASVLSKMARVVDLVDPAAWALNGTLRLGGSALGSLDNLIGHLDGAANGFDAGHIEVYTAMDSASALDGLVDAGVDLNTVTARVDDGIPVLEGPGIRIELPEGAFDAGVRAGDGGLDAAVPAPVREPELVAAGGVRGETGPGPVNSIVDDAPVRTEAGGTGESTVIREPDTTTGGGGDSASGGSDSGSGGSGSGGGDGDGASVGDGGPDAPPPTPIGDSIANGSDPMHSGAPGVTGEWHRGADDPMTPKDLHYGETMSSHGTSTYPTDPGTGTAGFDYRTDPGAPYGRHPDDTPLTKAEYDARYVFPGKNWDNYPPNAGAVRGTRVVYEDPDAFIRDYGDLLDRVGEPNGDYLGLRPDGVPASFEERGLPVSSLGKTIFEYRLTGKLPTDWTIEISEIAPAFGQPGGGLQLLIRDESGAKISVADLEDRGILG